ncbi:hypothetical protein IMSAGC004_03306 [Bacteroidaceae bacterium]|nr:hypothetical protein IMSAGC004_03306 [Bacteroidaceae bacterium]
MEQLFDEYKRMGGFSRNLPFGECFHLTRKHYLLLNFRENAYWISSLISK